MPQAELQVTCVSKPNRMSPHEHITHIGNRNQGWKFTREEAISRIEREINSFFTLDASTGKKMYVGVVRQQGKEPYLRTHADGKWNDNLLALSEC